MKNFHGLLRFSTKKNETCSSLLFNYNSKTIEIKKLEPEQDCGVISINFVFHTLKKLRYTDETSAQIFNFLHLLKLTVEYCTERNNLSLHQQRFSFPEFIIQSLFMWIIRRTVENVLIVIIISVTVASSASMPCTTDHIPSMHGHFLFTCIIIMLLS